MRPSKKSDLRRERRRRKRYKHKTKMSEKNKPVKIRSYSSSKKYGVAAKYVKELLDKGCKLLKVRPAWKSFPRLFNRAVVKVAS